MSGGRRPFWALALLLASASVAEATVYLTERAGRVYLSGEFELGDDARFAALLAQPRARKISVVYLDSFGGSIVAGIKIGRLIRKAGIATAVDASAARCDSACTLIFAGGVKRYYIGGAEVFEGTSGRGGLGYHPAHSRDPAWTRANYSDKGTGMMAAFYREMGQPGAAELMARAGFSTIYRPSGATALSLRIATSLSEPPQ